MGIVRNTLIIFSIMVCLIFIGVVALYYQGSVSGKDAMCISGIVSGVFVGLWFGKVKGLLFVGPILLCSGLICLPLFVLASLMMSKFRDLGMVFSYGSVGYSLLFFYILGCVWGSHLSLRPNSV